MAIDVSSPLFRSLAPHERIQALKRAADELYELEKAKPRDPEIDKVAAKHRGERS
jgi:hypothetical protein